MYDVVITQIPAMTLIAVEHRGSYMSIGKSSTGSLRSWGHAI